MDGGGAAGGWRTFTDRLGLKRISCCGAAWGLAPSTISVLESEDDEEINQPPENVTEQLMTPPSPAEVPAGRAAVHNPPPPGTVNLAAALAAEFRVAEMAGRGVNFVSGESSYTRRGVSLMRLFAEPVDGRDEAEAEVAVAGEGIGVVCCVCMVRSKGAAFIPCGHTYCRVCSRDLWVDRGTCPLCNRRIVEILDIF